MGFINPYWFYPFYSLIFQLESLPNSKWEDKVAHKEIAEKREKDNVNKWMANIFSVLPAFEPSNKKLLSMHQTPLLRK